MKAHNAYQMKVLKKKALVVKEQTYYQKKVLEKKDKTMKVKENIAIKQKIILENREDNYDIYLISKPDIHTFYYNNALSEFMKQNYVLSIKSSSNKRSLENEDTNECSKKHKLDEKEPTTEIMIMTYVNDENDECHTEIDDIVFMSSQTKIMN
jgi:hypothetical protein